MNEIDKVYRVGFTGTQQGMTLVQQSKLIDYLEQLHDRTPMQIELHHGDCVGSDYEMHHIGKMFGYSIVVHPPKNDSKRAYCEGDMTHVCKDYLDRNKDIVDSCELLIATPKSNSEEYRSGTWSTVRYARKKNKAVVIIYP